MIKLIFVMLFIPAQVEEVVNYGGAQIVYLVSESKVVISDSAWVSYKDLKVEADSIIYDLKHHLLFAYRCNPPSDSSVGFVRFRTAQDSLLGSELHYNLDTGRGMMKDGTTQIEEGYFWGEEVWLVAENTLNVTKGYYTTCDPPDYYFYAPRMKVYLNNTAIVEPVVLKVGGIPVAAAPFWFFPIARQRKSGLLPFKVGASNIEGRFAKGISYYWVINDYADLTFILDVMELKGWKPQVEGIYIINPYHRGQFLGSYIDERDTHQRRWSLNANHSSILPFGIDLKARADFQSDESYGADYTEDRIEWLRKELYSFAELSRSLKIASARMLFEERRDFERETRESRLPQIALSFYQRSLFPIRGEPHFYNNIYLSGGSQYNNFSEVTKDGIDQSRSLSGNFNLSSNQRLWGGINLSSGIGYSHTVYRKDSLYPGVNYNFSSGLGLNLYRVYGFEAFGCQGLLHKVTPNLTYSFLPETERWGFYERPVWGLGKMNQLGLQVTNLFQIKLTDGEKLDLLRLNLGTNYDLRAKENPIAPLTLGAELPSIRRFQTRFNSSYDLYNRKFTSYSLNTQLDLGDLFGLTFGGAGYTLQIEHFYSQGANELSSNLHFKPTHSWDVTARAHVDLESQKLVDYSLDLTRDLHCWEFLFSMSRLGDHLIYDFKLRIKALPDVAIGKGLFGFLLPE